MLAQLATSRQPWASPKLYADFTGTFVIEPADRKASPPIAALGMK